MPDGSVRTTSSISGLAAGQYTLHIEDINSCIADTVFTLTEPGRIGMDASLSQSLTGGYNINCAGWSTGSVFLEAVNNAGPVQFLWADGEIGSSRTGLQAGSYRVVMTDANGCQTDSIFTLTEPPAMHVLMVTIKPACNEMPDGQIIAHVTGGVSGGGFTYLWSDQSTGRSLSNVPGGNYTVTVTDANYCIVSQSVDLQPENELCLNIPNAISPNGDNTNETWELGMSELYPLLEVKVFDRWGSLVWQSEKGYPRPWDGTSNGRLLPMDSYHYIIDLNNGTRPMIGTITIVK
jgi:gliding motility-associated-like protein